MGTDDETIASAKPDALVRVDDVPLALPIRGSRNKKPPKRTIVDRVIDPESGAGVDVLFDRTSGQFEATVPGYPQSILGRDIGPVVKRTREILRATRQYQWKPTIVVNVAADHAFFDDAPPDVKRVHYVSGFCEVDHLRVRVDVEFYRIEIAPKPGDPSRFVCRPQGKPRKTFWRSSRGSGRFSDSRICWRAERGCLGAVRRRRLRFRSECRRMASMTTLTEKEADALAYIKRSEGRMWKASLRHAWENGRVNLLARNDDMTATLQRLRTKIGPSGLDKMAYCAHGEHFVQKSEMHNIGGELGPVCGACITEMRGMPKHR